MGEGGGGVDGKVGGWVDDLGWGVDRLCGKFDAISPSLCRLCVLSSGCRGDPGLRPCTTSHTSISPELSLSDGIQHGGVSSSPPPLSTLSPQTLGLALRLLRPRSLSLCLSHLHPPTPPCIFWACLRCK